MNRLFYALSAVCIIGTPIVFAWLQGLSGWAGLIGVGSVLFAGAIIAGAEALENGSCVPNGEKDEL